jgi:hypothetical protein
MLHHDDELARLGGLGHLRVAHLQQVGDLGKIFTGNDLEIGHDNPLDGGFLANAATQRLREVTLEQSSHDFWLVSA